MPDDAQFVFNADLPYIQQQAAKAAEARALLIKTKQSDLAAVQQIEAMNAAIDRANENAERKRRAKFGADVSAGRFSRGTLAAGRHQRMVEQFGSTMLAGDDARQQAHRAASEARGSSVSDFASQLEAGHRSAHEKEIAAARGAEEFTMAVKSAAGALALLGAAIGAIGSMAHGNAAGTASAFETVGGITSLAGRASKTLGVSYEGVLRSITSSSDRQGAARIYDYFTTRAETERIRPMPGQMEAAIQGMNSGAYTADQILEQERLQNFVVPRPGFDPRSFAGKYQFAQRAKNLSLWNGSVAASKNDEANMEAQAQLLNEELLRENAGWMPNWLSQYFAGTSAARRGTADAMRKNMVNVPQPFDQVSNLGAPQNPFVPGNVDMASSGRGAVEHAATKISNAVSRAVQSRRPDPHAGNTP